MGRYKRQQLEAFGLSDKIKQLITLNLLSLSLLLIYNAMEGMINKYSVGQILFHTLTFLIFILLIAIFRNMTTLIIIYISIGVLTVCFDSTVIGYSGIVYFLLACGLSRSNKFIILTALSAIVSLSVRLTMLKASIPLSIQMLLLFVFIFISLYIVFLKEQHKRVDISKAISERDKAVLKMYANGYSYELIIKTLQLNIETATVRKIIKRIRDESPCNNDIQFGKWLYENG